ncbi:hypothetical protein CI238_05962 [Colletotrichum incanum]|uniref:Uncharacterized protein n=1 Tax=Colletotrichum incanum TaxID=1573173 RepID=A0A161WCE9_COLIC|nr:hypothetical protein CI238_05962 [Colletotrichum incanum]
MQWYPRDRYSKNELVELMRKFTNMGWPRYFDKEGTRPIKDLERAPKSIYILMKEHLWHCGYSIMQTHLWITLGMDPPEAYDEYGNVKLHYPCAEKGFACRSDP